MKFTLNFNLPEGFDFNFISLSFKDKLLEKSFIAEFFKSSLKIQRIAILAGILIFMLFGLLDLRLFQGADLNRILIIRYIFGAPVSLVLLSLTFLKFYEKYWQTILSIIIIHIGVTIVAIIIATPTPICYYNFPGLMLVLFYSYVLLRLRFVYSIFTGFFITGIYLIFSKLLTDLPSENYYNNSFFFLASNITGLVSSYMIELYERKEFYLRKIVETEKENVNKLLINQKFLNEMKSRFIDVTSHVFRNPLTVIMSSSQVLNELFMKSNSSVEMNFNNNIFESANDLLYILNRMQFFTKIESGEIKYFPNHVDLKEVIEHAISKVKRLERKSNNYIINISEDSSILINDPVILEIMLSELISNAVRYSKVGSTINIESFLKEDDSICIRLTDESEGIKFKFDDIHELTHNYSETSNISGMGLGLTIVQTCLNLINATFNFTKTEDDKSQIEICFKHYKSNQI